MINREIDTETLLRNCDWINSRLDMTSIHPKNIWPLLAMGYIEDCDPEDGENVFYTLTQAGAKILNND